MTRGRSRFHRYEGGDPLAPPVDLAEALDAIGDGVMAGSSPERAMREYLRGGGEGRAGLDELRRRLLERRRELLRNHNLDGTLRQVAELLDRAVLAERKRVVGDVEMDEADRVFAQLRLDELSTSPAAAVRELSDYDWRSPEARADYQRIQDLLAREMLDQRFGGMRDALQNVTDQDRAEIARMLDDLNHLLDKHRRGEDAPEDFERFMAEHGRFFPENPANVDELIDTLAARSAAAQRMLNSMTPEQREELLRLSEQAFGSPALQESLARLDGSLRALRPGQDWTGSERFEGDDPLGQGDGMRAMQDLSEIDELSEQLAQQYEGARLDDIDLDKLSRQLGEDAAVAARTLRDLERVLRRDDTFRRDSTGMLQLTPKATRKLGASLLRDIADRMTARRGERDTQREGAGAEPSGATRPWEFGDTSPWDIPRTVLNGIVRRAGGAEGRRIIADDIEVADTEARAQAAVALLVDTSFSMEITGRWVPMKRTALALHTLIRTRFRGDRLKLIAFSRFAEETSIETLTGMDATWNKGTNLHHGLLLANRHFRKNPDAQPVLLIVTDGEPTAHLEPDGTPVFFYPPSSKTIAVTVRELETSARLGAQITIFRLGDDRGLARFVDSMAAKVHGRVVAPELGDLGAAVVDSYLGVRTGAPTSEWTTVDGRGDAQGWDGASRGFWTGY